MFIIVLNQTISFITLWLLAEDLKNATLNIIKNPEILDHKEWKRGVH